MLEPFCRPPATTRRVVGRPPSATLTRSDAFALVQSRSSGAPQMSMHVRPAGRDGVANGLPSAGQVDDRPRVQRASCAPEACASRSSTARASAPRAARGSPEDRAINPRRTAGRRAAGPQRSHRLCRRRPRPHVSARYGRPDANGPTTRRCTSAAGEVAPRATQGPLARQRVGRSRLTGLDDPYGHRSAGLVSPPRAARTASVR